MTLLSAFGFRLSAIGCRLLAAIGPADDIDSCA
jgi:hypothetical protein